MAAIRLIVGAAILVKFSFACRPWALPVLVTRYRSPEWNKEHHRRHKTLAELMRQMLAVLLRANK
jgi:hypothetical protein